MRYSYGLNRTLCGVLEEMRKLNDTRNFSSLLGLIEEAQSMANRMEAALYDKKDIEHAREVIRKLQAEIKQLQAAKSALGGKSED
jgi:hypothetical protein